MEGQLSRDAARAERGVARLLGQGQRSREAQGRAGGNQPLCRGRGPRARDDARAAREGRGVGCCARGGASGHVTLPRFRGRQREGVRGRVV